MIQETHSAIQDEGIASETTVANGEALEVPRSVGFSTEDIAIMRRFFELLDAWDQQVNDND